jgi:hypothetical protein
MVRSYDCVAPRISGALQAGSIGGPFRELLKYTSGHTCPSLGCMVKPSPPLDTRSTVNNIINSKGMHVGVVIGAAIFDLSGRKLYDLKGINIYPGAAMPIRRP